MAAALGQIVDLAIVVEVALLEACEHADMFSVERQIAVGLEAAEA